MKNRLPEGIGKKWTALAASIVDEEATAWKEALIVRAQARQCRPVMTHFGFGSLFPIPRHDKLIVRKELGVRGSAAGGQDRPAHVIEETGEEPQ